MGWLKRALTGSDDGPSEAARKAAQELVTQGYVAARQGRLGDARNAYVAASRKDPTLAIAHFNLGQLALQRFNALQAATAPGSGVGDDPRALLDEAATALRRAVVLDPAHAASWRTLARVEERLGLVGAARRAWLEVAILLDAPAAGAKAEAAPLSGDAAGDTAGDKRPPASAAEGGWHDDHTHGDEANTARVQARGEALREAARMAPLAALEDALQVARAALAPAADAALADADHVARCVAARAALLAALDAATAAGQAEPAGVRALLGSLARQAGDLPTARLDLEAAVASDRRDGLAWRELATVCMAQEDLTAALRASLAALREDPADAGIACNVGVCHLGLGDLAQAEEFLSIARDLAPKDPIVKRALVTLAEAKRR